jgi:hypothetical protein
MCGLPERRVPFNDRLLNTRNSWKDFYISIVSLLISPKRQPVIIIPHTSKYLKGVEIKFEKEDLLCQRLHDTDFCSRRKNVHLDRSNPVNYIKYADRIEKLDDKASPCGPFLYKTPWILLG